MWPFLLIKAVSELIIVCLVHFNEFLILSLHPAEPDWGSVPAMALSPLLRTGFKCL